MPLEKSDTDILLSIWYVHIKIEKSVNLQYVVLKRLFNTFDK